MSSRLLLRFLHIFKIKFFPSTSEDGRTGLCVTESFDNKHICPQRDARPAENLFMKLIFNNYDSSLFSFSFLFFAPRRALLVLLVIDITAEITDNQNIINWFSSCVDLNNVP